MMKYITHAAAIGLIAFFPSLTSLAQTGADTYKAKCQMCHGVTGLGDTPAGKTMKARPFNSPDVLKESDADLITVIKKGKTRCLLLLANSVTRKSMTSWRSFTHCRNEGCDGQEAVLAGLRQRKFHRAKE